MGPHLNKKFKDYRCKVCGADTWATWKCDTCKKKGVKIGNARRRTTK